MCAIGHKEKSGENRNEIILDIWRNLSLKGNAGCFLSRISQIHLTSMVHDGIYYANVFQYYPRNFAKGLFPIIRKTLPRFAPRFFSCMQLVLGTSGVLRDM